uniref:Uncharacterized protein n=1 Tax=Seriola lalandi dorsalis TaxID=1841481 RepID=A0A3B4Y9X5_SERLL
VDGCKFLSSDSSCGQTPHYHKDNASEGAGDTGSSEKADAEGSSDEDEGALVIDEKNERGGTKRKASPKRPKDTGVEGDSKVESNKSNTEAKLNDVAGPKATAPSSQSESKPEAQENAPAGGQLTADKVRLSQVNFFFFFFIVPIHNRSYLKALFK